MRGNSPREPLVALFTPVHNGGDSLAACLQSVRAQDYHNWIHLVADNASRDATRQIAESFAATDPRVKVLPFDEMLPMLENFNRGLAFVPSVARYLKQVHADDTIHPACLRTMVAAAERDPTVAFVVSRFYVGSVLCPPNAPTRATRLSGPTVARQTLLGTSNVLGTPSVPLLRIARMVGWPFLFRPDRFPPGHPSVPPHNQGDKESYLATLERDDIAFLPEPLVFLKEESHSATGFTRRVGGWHASRVDLLLRRGPRFMDHDTLRKAIRRTAWKWTRSVAWRSLKQFRRDDPEFRLYHSLCLDDLVPRLREAGYPSEAALLANVASVLARFGPTRFTHAAPAPAPRSEPERSEVR
jgi:glycosyltransferase involved in cell wall biosynthesis